MLKTTLALFFLGINSALAHPGHEEAILRGEAHWLTQVDHLAVVIPVLLLAATIVVRIIRMVRTSSRLVEGRKS